MKFLTLALILVFSCIACSNEPASWPSEKFTAEAWANTAENQRFVFAQDIVESEMFIGKSENDVVRLLGPPSSRNTADHRMSYVIKVGGDGFDQVFALEMVFAPDGSTVKSVNIRGD